ncbi:MAG: hypothetical protein IPI67_38845 [Myxococcales bacterium]|nr:hypothetical protein [Myxococcales bacterium]
MNRPFVSLPRHTLLLAAVFATGALPTDSMAGAKSPPTPATCVQSWPEARYRNYGYDHIVHIRSRCTPAATCYVSTNVSAKPIRVRLEPQEHKEVLTFQGAPSRAFVPHVRCRLDGSPR